MLKTATTLKDDDDNDDDYDDDYDDDDENTDFHTYMPFLNIGFVIS